MGKLGKLPAVSAPAARSVLGDWHAHLLRYDRQQCVLFCHDTTRFCLFMAGLRAEQFKIIERLHRELWTAVMEASGLPAAWVERLDISVGPLAVDRATDRSVLGSLNVANDQLGALIHHHSPHVLALDPIATSMHLNERPCMVRGQLVWPQQAMEQLIAQWAQTQVH